MSSSMAEEKKEDPGDMKPEENDAKDTMKPAPAPPKNAPPLSPSKRRAKAASSAGLSELSKQLRILQAKNESQAVDINRLERQLRILAELQGISVADLRKALEDACANEAFGELQHRVAKLRAELEASQLAKRAEFAKDAAGKEIANLELRVGELEEVEEKHQTEIHHLYEQLRHERERATRLEAERDQHKKDAQEYLDKLNKERARAAKLESTFQDQMQKHMEEQAQKLQQLAKQAAKAKQEAEAHQAAANAASASSTASRKEVNSNSNNDSKNRSLASISPEMAADYERMVQTIREKDQEIRKLKEQLQMEHEKYQKLLKEQQEKINQQEMNKKVDQDKMALTVRQLEDSDSQNELRLAQYKARFAVQDERIADMGQQLNSLYVAFQLLKEEMDAEDMKQAALKCNLDEADAEMAKQIHQMEKQKSQRGGFASTPASAPSARSSRSTYRNNDDDGFASGFGSPTNSRAVALTPYTSSSSRAAALTPYTNSTRGDGFGSQRSAAAAAAAAASADGMSDSRMGGYGVDGDVLEQQYEAYAKHTTNPSNSVPRVITAPSTVDSYSTTGIGYPVSPSAIGTPVYSSSQPRSNSPSGSAARTPTTWQLLFPEENLHATTTSNPSDGVLISGLLIVKSKNSVVRKWKSKMSKLYLRGDHHQLDIGDSKSYALEFGISKVEYYPNHPLSFMVHINPFDSTAPIVYAAGTCEKDYNAWMQALTKATSGGDCISDNPPLSPRRSLSAEVPPSSPRRMASGSESFMVSVSSHGSSSQPSNRDEEDADLKRALELSKQMV